MSRSNSSAEKKVPFSREEITRAVRLEILATASLLAQLGRYEDASIADRYVGVALKGYSFNEASEDDIARIPVEEHGMFRSVMTAFDYAYQVATRGGTETSVSECIDDVGALLYGFPQTDCDGEPSPLDKHNPQKLRQVLETAMARYSLDFGFDLSVRELALLANMGEPAVRTSLSSGGVKTVSAKPRDPNKVPNDQALEWLRGRRGFIETQFDEVPNWNVFKDIDGDFCSDLRSLLSRKEISASALALQAGLPERWTIDLMSGTANATVDINRLTVLATCLEAPIPNFVARAVDHLLKLKVQN